MIGLGGEFKTSTQNHEIHYLWLFMQILFKITKHDSSPSFLDQFENRATCFSRMPDERYVIDVLVKFGMSMNRPFLLTYLNHACYLNRHKVLYKIMVICFVLHMGSGSDRKFFSLPFNPLKTSPEYTRAGVYGKCVL